MRTVKELSQLTGISVRTLHYYDEIGLLKPTEKSEAGYRRYDDQALETLRQILYFREFELPLRGIKRILEDPNLNRRELLQVQRRMLLEKKRRLERLIADIDQVLEGENGMDFTIFDRTELEALCQSSLEHMPERLRETIRQEFGSLEQWKRHYIQRCAQEDMQLGYAKLVGWYGGKKRALDMLTNPPGAEAGEACVREVEGIIRQLREKRMLPVDSVPVKQLVRAYGSALKQFLRVSDETEAMGSVAASYRQSPIRQRLDEQYGEGTAEFLASAIETFYSAAGGKDDLGEA